MSRRFASDDDASDLLAGILADTESDAVQEQSRRTEELAARRSQEVERLERERASRRQEGLARLEAERQRREALSQRRQEALRAEDGGDTYAADATVVSVTPMALPDLELQRRLEAAQAARLEAEARIRAVQRAPATQTAPPPPTRAHRGGLMAGGIFLAAAAALLLVAVATGGVALAVADPEHTSAVYAKAELQPSNLEAGAVESGFVALTPAVAVEPEPKAKTKRTRRDRARRDRNPVPGRPRFDFGSGGDDPFSSKRD